MSDFYDDDPWSVHDMWEATKAELEAHLAAIALENVITLEDHRKPEPPDIVA